MSTALLQLLVKQPNLLIDHAQAYVELIADDLGAVSADYGFKARLMFTTVCCLTSGATLVGVAVMLACALPDLRATALWVLALTPAPLFAMALWCQWALRSNRTAPPFEDVLRQLKADRDLLLTLQST
jgi:uncharacterized membrane protein YqjE